MAAEAPAAVTSSTRLTRVECGAVLAIIGGADEGFSAGDVGPRTVDDAMKFWSQQLRFMLCKQQGKTDCKPPMVATGF